RIPSRHPSLLGTGELPWRKNILVHWGLDRCACALMAPKITVAIDFGTTRSAWAYRVNGQAANKILVRIPDTARASPSSIIKTETVVLMSGRGRGELLAFGPAALQQYAEDDDEDNALFRWFKVDLCEIAPGQTTASVTAMSTAGHVVPLLGVMKASLVYFKEDVISFLSATSGRPVRATDVKWVLTVPAIYDDFAKNFMRHAAHEAGMISRVSSTRLRLCLEPEAACLAVTMEDNPLTCDAEGKKIMIVDCGGGTVDITVYNIVSVDPLRLAEAVAPKGGLWGSTHVDKAFKGWLRVFLGGEWFRTIEKTGTLVSITMAWERMKAEFPGPDPTQPLRLILSDLAQFGMTLSNMEGLRTQYNDGRPLQYCVGGKKFMVSLPSSLVTSFYEPTLRRITEGLRRINRDSLLYNLHRTYVVGGFSKSPLLRHAVQTELERPNCRVVQVHEPDIAIVKGAVMFSETSAIFNSRKARLTYGQKCALPFDCMNAEHCRRREAGCTVIDDDGKTLVIDCIDVHIRIGDDIPANGVLSRRGYTPTNLDASETTIVIYASYERHPEFVDDGSCFQVGAISFDLDTTRRTCQERGFRVELAFGGPELTVKILHRTQEREIADAVMKLSRVPE
ncbi:unnamed protein product, partial [Scytosiphon promiscuus]